MVIPEGEESKQWIKNLFEEIMSQNFPNLVKERHTSQEAKRVPNKMDPKRSTPRYIIIKMAKFKDKKRNLKATREKQLVIYKRVPIRLSSDFSTETFLAGRDKHEIFKVMKSKDLQSRLYYPARISFKIEE